MSSTKLVLKKAYNLYEVFILRIKCVYVEKKAEKFKKPVSKKNCHNSVKKR